MSPPASQVRVTGVTLELTTNQAPGSGVAAIQCHCVCDQQRCNINCVMLSCRTGPGPHTQSTVLLRPHTLLPLIPAGFRGRLVASLMPHLIPAGLGSEAGAPRLISAGFRGWLASSNPCRVQGLAAGSPDLIRAGFRGRRVSVGLNTPSQSNDPSNPSLVAAPPVTPNTYRPTAGYGPSSCTWPLLPQSGGQGGRVNL